jgi:formamidopyrimidine-DNA glycosylase
VRDPADVPGIARLGPDPFDPAFTAETLAGLLAGRRTQIKGVLRDQSIIAGIGNAYSDEVLHAARMSPYALAASLTSADVQGLYDAMRGTLEDAVSTASGKPPADLKDAKRRGMRVHGRRGHREKRLLRRQLARILRDLPDRRQGAGRPPDVAAPQVETHRFGRECTGGLGVG